MNRLLIAFFVMCLSGNICMLTKTIVEKKKGWSAAGWFALVMLSSLILAYNL